MSEFSKLFHMMENVPTWHILLMMAAAFVLFILTFAIGMKTNKNKTMLNICCTMLILSGIAQSFFFVWGLISLCGWKAVVIGMTILFVGAALYPYANDYVQSKKQQKVAG